MAEKRVFRIGQLVQVNMRDEARWGYEDKQRLVMRVRYWNGLTGKSSPDEIVRARITGVKVMHEGKYTPAARGFSFESPAYPDDSEPAYLEHTNQVVLWGVRLGYRNKERYFFPDDIESLGEQHTIFKSEVHYPLEHDIPYFYSGPYSSDYREKLSRESKSWGRDSKGRWSK